MKTNEGCGAAPQQISLVDGAFTTADGDYPFPTTYEFPAFCVVSVKA